MTFLENRLVNAVAGRVGCCCADGHFHVDVTVRPLDPNLVPMFP